MANNQLLANEEIHSELLGGKFKLTNYRVLYEQSRMGKAYGIHILLENISSTELKYRSSLLYVVLFVFSVGFGAFAFSEGEDEVAVAGLGIGLIFLVLYLFTRTSYLIISSKGGSKIHVQAKGLKKEAIASLMNDVDQAILERFKSTENIR